MYKNNAVEMINPEIICDLDIGVVILSPDYRVIGINKYASNVLNLDISKIGKSVYKYHKKKSHSRISYILNEARKSKHDLPEAIIMNVLNRVLAVNVFKMKLKHSSLKSFFVMAFVDVNKEICAEISKDKKIDIKKLSIFDSSSFVFLDLPSIYFIQCDGNYCKVYTENRLYYVRLALRDIQIRYTGHKLFRVHRSFLVNLDRVHKIRKDPEGNNIIDFEKKGVPSIPVARRRINDLKNALTII